MTMGGRELCTCSWPRGSRAFLAPRLSVPLLSATHVTFPINYLPQSLSHEVRKQRKQKCNPPLLPAIRGFP